MDWKRLPVGGLDEIMRRQREDYVLQLLQPTINQAMQELPTVVQALKAKCHISDRSGIGRLKVNQNRLPNQDDVDVQTVEQSELELHG